MAAVQPAAGLTAGQTTASHHPITRHPAANPPLWGAEELPAGWGDTYPQAAGQSSDITHVPNGTY